MERLRPLNDFIFKKLFGGSSNSDNWKHTITKKHNRKTKNKN